MPIFASDDDEEVIEPEKKFVLPREPLKLDNLLIRNVNTWGNVEYNVPLRTSYNETRTGTNVAIRHIPPIPHSYDVKIKEPLPERVCGRDMVVIKETYRTTSSAYQVQPNPNKAMERADVAGNCKNVIYMTGVEKRLQKKTVVEPIILSETKDKFRGMKRPPLAPPEIIIRAPDPEYIFDVVASGRNEVSCIPETGGGYRRLMDPYFTTYRANHRMWTPDEQYGGLAAKDQITIYSDNNTPKVRGFGPRHKEIWMPLLSRPKVGVFDKIHVKKEFKEVAAARNPVSNIKGIFETETKRKYKVPFTVSDLATWGHGESFDLAPFPPNPYQTTIAPFMYCSDYCHIAQGTHPYCIIEQFRRELEPHKKCQSRHIVSRESPI